MCEREPGQQDAGAAHHPQDMCEVKGAKQGQPGTSWDGIQTGNSEPLVTRQDMCRCTTDGEAPAWVGGLCVSFCLVSSLPELVETPVEPLLAMLPPCPQLGLSDLGQAT